MPLMRSRLLPKLPWKALSFDGIDDYVEVPDSPSLNPSEVSVEVLFLARSVPSDYYPYVVSKSNNGVPQYAVQIVPSTLQVMFAYSDGNSIEILYSSSEIELGRYQHVVCTYSAGIVKIYIDGKLDVASTTSVSLGALSVPLRVAARYPDGRYFSGYVALVRIYSRALTDGEVEWNYYHPDDPIRSGLVLWLHYDSIDEVNGVWKDKTTNGNDGTIYGATAVEFTKPPHRLLSPSRILSPVR